MVEKIKAFARWISLIPLLHAPVYFLAIVGVILLVLTFVL
tara:strand:+ start:156 stop:275 length:120 start_codon:yes stop_codon:yes gene_type:complete